MNTPRYQLTTCERPETGLIAGRTTQGGTLPEDVTLRPLLDRAGDFQPSHPEFTIAAPHDTLSHLWEVSTSDGTAQWDNGFRMMDDLEARYPE
jgi:hypothetical protein